MEMNDKINTEIDQTDCSWLFIICVLLCTHRISISCPRISRTALPIAVICSSFLPPKLMPNQRKFGNDISIMCTNCGSIRVFFGRSITVMPSTFTWHNGLFRIDLEIDFIVLDESSKCSIQLHIFSVFNILWEVELEEEEIEHRVSLPLLKMVWCSKEHLPKMCMQRLKETNDAFVVQYEWGRRRATQAGFARTR